jgi:3',5'-nucleoside bisphosphate phosphatase
MLIDLHTHSTCSDGTLTPEELVKLAAENRIEVIALTDHDTTAGLQQFISSAGRYNITAVPGIELSAEWKAGHCHFVGLNLEGGNKELESVLIKIRSGRNIRNEKILSKLNQLGYPITMDQVKRYACEEVVARPHIARALVEAGYANTLQDAFDRFLDKDAAAYAERFRLQPQDVVKVLKAAGATVVLAHPDQLRITEEELKSFASGLITSGLDGIEVYTYNCTDDRIRSLIDMAEELGLKCSGGSDFHGENKPERRLGFYKDELAIPEHVLEILKKM